MKRLVMAIALILITVTTGIISLVVIDKVEEKMVSKLDNIIKWVNEENSTQLNKAIDDTFKQWDTEKPIMNILIGQQETNEITADLKMIEHFSVNGDKSALLLYIYECKTDLEKIKTTNEPSLSTIF